MGAFIYLGTNFMNLKCKEKQKNWQWNRKIFHCSNIWELCRLVPI